MASKQTPQPTAESHKSTRIFGCWQIGTCLRYVSIWYSYSYNTVPIATTPTPTPTDYDYDYDL